VSEWVSEWVSECVSEWVSEFVFDELNFFLFVVLVVVSECVSV
jgi:hypothetical protein